MAYAPILTNPFTLPGSGAGFLDVRRIGTLTPVVTVDVPASVQLPPVITGLNPTTGDTSSTLVITGSRFTGANLVSINSGLVASFVVNSDTQITCVLSTVQSTGRVRVTTPFGTATSAIDFVVTQPANPSFTQTLAGEGNLTYPAYVDTLTWSAASTILLKYNNPVQAQASSPGASSMAVFLSGNQIAQLNYDPLDENHAFAVVVSGVTYYNNADTGLKLTFTNGTVNLA